MKNLPETRRERRVGVPGAEGGQWQSPSQTGHACGSSIRVRGAFEGIEGADTAASFAAAWGFLRLGAIVVLSLVLLLLCVRARVRD